MHIDYFLKFSDQAQADAVLFDEQTSVQGDVVETFKVPKYSAVDVIGIIYKPTGEVIDTEMGEVPEMVPLEGWHANVRHVAEASELMPHQVFPATPARVWA